MAKKQTRGVELEIEKARNDSRFHDGRWADIPKLLKTSKSTLSESYKTLVDCEFQIEIQFNKHRVEHPVDEPMNH